MAWEEDFLRQVSDAVYATAQSVALVGASRSLSQGNGISSCLSRFFGKPKPNDSDDNRDRCSHS